LIIDCSKKAFSVLRSQVNPHQEEVWCLSLNSNLELIAKDMLFRGTVSECFLHPRDLIRNLCCRNASTFILAHNHPSGRLAPSLQDKKVTRKILKLSQLIEIPIRDHL